MHIIAEFRVENTSERDEKLGAAVASAQRELCPDRTRGGLLVTRHDFGHFSVALSADVPLGSIVEKDFASRNSRP